MFALISSRSGSQSAMLLRWALQGHHGPLVLSYLTLKVPSKLAADSLLLAQLSWRKEAELNYRYAQLSGIRLSTFSNIYFRTAGWIKAKFYVEPTRVVGKKVSISRSYDQNSALLEKQKLIQSCWAIICRMAYAGKRGPRSALAFGGCLLTIIRIHQWVAQALMWPEVQDLNLSFVHMLEDLFTLMLQS